MDLVYRFDPFAPLALRKIDDAEAAIRELEKGSEKFRRVVEHARSIMLNSGTEESLILPFDPLTYGIALVEGASVAQEPFAIVLGCSDARVPTEVVFHQDSNDLFVVRVAGNVLGIECLGSIDYAVGRMPSLKLAVVLGHTNCGAVTSAVDMYLAPTEYAGQAVSFALRSLVDRVMIAVRGAASALERICGPQVVGDLGYRAAIIEIAVFLNAALTAFDLRRALGPSLALDVVYGVFDLSTHRIRSKRTPADDAPMLAPAPAEVTAFDNLAADLARDVIARGVIDPAFAART